MYSLLIICGVTGFALGIMLARQLYSRRIETAFRKGQEELFVRRAQSDERVTTLQNQIEERDSAIEAQTHRIEELNAQLERIKELEGDLARLRTEKDSLETQQVDLERMLRENDRLCSGIVEVTSELNIPDPLVQSRLKELREASRESSTRLARLRPAVVRKRREDSATREALAQLATLLEKALITSRAALSGINGPADRPQPAEPGADAAKAKSEEREELR
jgi:chromosome segregation ATPase